MHRLHDIISLIPDEDNYLVDTLLEWQFGKLMTKYIKDFVKGDRSKFASSSELVDVLKDPYCALISEEATPLNKLNIHMFKDICYE